MTHSLSSHLEGARSSFTPASLKILLPWASVFGYCLAIPGSCPGAAQDRAVARAARQIVVGCGMAKLWTWLPSTAQHRPFQRCIV